jgi:hypothetical protein
MAKRLTFALERSEAQFFKKRFLDLFPNSITSYILKCGSRNDCRSQLFDLQCPKNPQVNHLLNQGRTYSHIAMGAYYARWRCGGGSGAYCRTMEENARHFERWLSNNLQNTKGWQYSRLTSPRKSGRRCSRKGI